MADSPGRTAPLLILASGSRYRRTLLERLGLPFLVDAPELDEQPRGDEPPAETARRLAVQKAVAVAARHPGALVIGADQVAWNEAGRLDKPGSVERARAQLAALSGRTAQFDTAVCLLDADRQRRWLATVRCEVRFRALTPARIDAYLAREDVLDCAGSAKSEGLGIALIEWMRTDDPTALVGLPLIALTGMLEQAERPVLP